MRASPFPSLAALPKERRRQVMKDYQTRLWRLPAFWLSLGVGLILCATVQAITLPVIRPILQGLPAWLSGAIAGGPAGCLVVLPMMLMLRKTLKALSRDALWRNGLCGNCAYDLRGTPDRCPECGASADPAEPALARSNDVV